MDWVQGFFPPENPMFWMGEAVVSGALMVPFKQRASHLPEPGPFEDPVARTSNLAAKLKFTLW